MSIFVWRHCWGGFQQITYVSVNHLLMLIQLMLIFILWYQRRVRLMLGEQLCQRVALFGDSCSFDEIKHLLFLQPEFRGHSFTRTVEMENKKRKKKALLLRNLAYNAENKLRS